jgi:hypothetical protein
VRLCCDKSARREKKRMALGRIPSRMDLTQAEVGEDEAGLDRTLEVGTDIWIANISSLCAWLFAARIQRGHYLLRGSCFFRFREASRGSKLVDKASDGLFKLRLDARSRSSKGFCRRSDLASDAMFLRAFEDRLHVAGLDMHRKILAT